MEWLWLILLGIIAGNVVFFGALYVLHLIDRRRERHHEQRKIRG